MKLNGQPIDIMQPECMKMKAIEPVLLLGAERFANLDIRITVKGGGRVAQIYGRLFLRMVSWISYPPGHLQSHRCLLPEVYEMGWEWVMFRRQRADQAWDQGHPRELRSFPHCCRYGAGGVLLICRSSSLRAQEVRRSFCPCPLPEVLPIKAQPVSGCALSLYRTKHTVACFFPINPSNEQTINIP